jgi:stage III sporulation protein AC
MEELHMNVEIIFKIAAVGILVAVVNQVLLKAGREELAMMTTLTGLVIVLLMVINLISQLFQSVKSIFRLY